MIDAVFAIGEDGQVHFAEAAALRRKTSPRCSRYALGCCACFSLPQCPTIFQSRSKWRLFGLEFWQLNVAKWPLFAGHDIVFLTG